VETEIALEAVTDHVQVKVAIEVLVQVAVTAEIALLVREVVQAEIEIAQELETKTTNKPWTTSGLFYSTAALL
jgi:hypothetical protein